VRGNSQALFGKRPTEKAPAKGTSSAVDFTREAAWGNGPVDETGTAPRADFTVDTIVRKRLYGLFVMEVATGACTFST
jgi:hypothetical protein